MSKELENVMTNHFEKKHLIALVCIVIVTAVVWNLPTEIFHINGLTVVHQRIIAIFVFATLMWISEAIPSWATSLGIITLMCLTVSNHSLFFFKGEENEVFGKLLSSKEIMATFANPVIILFLGGFFLAIAATKSGLDVLLAKNLIRPFGRKSENVLLGFLLILRDCKTKRYAETGAYRRDNKYDNRISCFVFSRRNAFFELAN